MGWESQKGRSMWPFEYKEINPDIIGYVTKSIRQNFQIIGTQFNYLNYPNHAFTMIVLTYEDTYCQTCFRKEDFKFKF